ncbi:uncharacterized protein AMSG_10478 [Thecamonas trahens ATCC 50062]|uniref:Uncharacterized protein n=1 Tax=Thecamonas trahens ATCC 50062 TaxID=461836 RepID=A0A0L0DR40_THETB|nr:hypothetical protein AMSG_10478 [Thecamonas trahens ATCC 50062]KNC54481.1 hypothetical protein AMSG_10478 [Thecamonas trahens ATCC 50062]|eukprot:XP_013753635.1 hypothetical protein AMSG_10478 [Thecamonas trahens ATCC 50062]
MLDASDTISARRQRKSRSRSSGVAVKAEVKAAAKAGSSKGKSKGRSSKSGADPARSEEPRSAEARDAGQPKLFAAAGFVSGAVLRQAPNQRVPRPPPMPPPSLMAGAASGGVGGVDPAQMPLRALLPKSVPLAAASDTTGVVSIEPGARASLPPLPSADARGAWWASPSAADSQPLTVAEHPGGPTADAALFPSNAGIALAPQEAIRHTPPAVSTVVVGSVHDPPPSAAVLPAQALVPPPRSADAPHPATKAGRAQEWLDRARAELPHVFELADVLSPLARTSHVGGQYRVGSARLVAELDDEHLIFGLVAEYLQHIGKSASPLAGAAAAAAELLVSAPGYEPRLPAAHPRLDGAPRLTAALRLAGESGLALWAPQGEAPSGAAELDPLLDTLGVERRVISAYERGALLSSPFRKVDPAVERAREKERAMWVSGKRGRSRDEPSDSMKVNIWDARDEVNTHLTWTASGDIESGTLNALVLAATQPQRYDTTFVEALLMTFPSVAPVACLITKLMERFNVPDSLDDDGTRVVDAVEARAIQARVLDVVERLFSEYPYVLEQGDVQALVHFLESVAPRAGWQAASERLMGMLRELQAGRRAVAGPAQFDTSAPALLMSGKAAIEPGDSVLAMNPVEVARQLTLIEYDLFAAIRPTEFLGLAWSEPHLRDKATNLRRATARFEAVSFWVATTILRQPSKHMRAGAITFFIRVATAFRALNNFSGVMCVLAALSNSAVSRLKFTFPLLQPDVVEEREALDKLLSVEFNSKRYKEALRSCNPPCIPYLGLFLSQLTFIEEGNDPFNPDGTINFFKHLKAYETIAEIRRYQLMPYNLRRLPQLLTYLNSLSYASNAELYDLSIQVEPRGASSVP